MSYSDLKRRRVIHQWTATIGGKDVELALVVLDATAKTVEGIDPFTGQAKIKERPLPDHFVIAQRDKDLIGEKRWIGAQASEELWQSICREMARLAVGRGLEMTAEASEREPIDRPEASTGEFHQAVRREARRISGGLDVYFEHLVPYRHLLENGGDG